MSGTARLSPFRVHVADQILAALTEAAPLPLSTMAIEEPDWVRPGPGLSDAHPARVGWRGGQGHSSGHQALFLAGAPG